MKTAIDEVLGLGKPQKKVAKKGMEAKDLDIQVMADRVAIAGERKSETKSEENGRTRSEFRSHAKAQRHKGVKF